MSEEIVNEEVLDTETEEVVETDTVETDESGVDEQNGDFEAKLKEKDDKIRQLESVIVKHKKESKIEKPKESSELSQNDLYALIKNDVHEDDVSEVVDYARVKKITVKEALQSNVVKAILRDKEETRKTAQVSNTGTTRKSPTKVDADTLVEKARKGDLPQSEEEMKKVFLKMKGLDK